jgi:organic radical activating enzyme
LGYDALEHRDPEDSQRLVVEWIFSSVCNYACSYCPAELHDGRVRWPDYDVALGFCKRVIDWYRARPVTFLFSGGEVTLYRRFTHLAREVRALGAAVAVLSNASQPATWWDQALPHLDEAILSYHVEFASLETFAAVVERAAQRIPVQVNLVMVPERFDECRAIAQALERRFPNVTIHQKPMLERWRHLGGYHKPEREALRVANDAGMPTAGGLRRTLLKGDMVKRRRDGGDVVATPINLILDDENHWFSWECAIGLESLVVRWDEVFRGICRVGGRIGSIYDPDIVFPSGAVTCTQTSCNCIAGIKATKWRRGLTSGL